MSSIPSWDGPAWDTSIDTNIKSLRKIVIYFISFFEINKRTLRLASYKFEDSQLIDVWNFPSYL